MDREKVIEAYERCKNPFDRKCEKCPYEKDCCHDGIPMFVIKKMVDLLKEQEEKEARLLTADEVRNMNAGTAFGIESYIEHDGRRMPGCTWALRTESLIISHFGTMFPDTVHDIPYNTLEKNENTGKQERHQYRFWSKKPTFEQIKEIPWD